jgi:hypothetical protein
MSERLIDARFKILRCNPDQTSEHEQPVEPFGRLVLVLGDEPAAEHFIVRHVVDDALARDEF